MTIPAAPGTRPFLRITPERAPVTAVYGGGGPFGIAYGLGVTHALRDAGVPLESCDAIGTSAGSWVASCLATGVGFEELRDQAPVRVPNLRPGWLRGVARDLFGTVQDGRVRASAVRLPTLRRRLLDGGRLPLADLVAASSAVPGLFAPARVGRHLYVDGGVRSMASANLAPAADHLLVVAPIAGPMFGPGGRAMELLLAEEMRRWERRTGGRAHLIRPDTAIAGLASTPLHLFDKARAVDVYPMAYAQGARLIASRPNLLRLVAA
ncbi:MAG: patatin-like phospholipase family protein [Mycobacteriales bacterium]